MQEELPLPEQTEMAGLAFGRGMAAIVTTSFGFIWLGWGLSVVRSLPVVIWVMLCSVAVVLLAFAALAVRRGRRMMRALGVSRDDFWKTRRKAFRMVTFLEVVGCIVVVILANVFRRPDLIALGISLVVGLHFLPLGKIFGVASYYWVGGLVVIWDILTVAALKSWNPVASACIATGVILWGTAIYALTRSLRIVPAQANRGGELAP